MIRSLSQKRLRNILILLFFVLAQTTWAQLTLPSTSPYTQNFDAIGSGLPAGWTTRSGANASSQGADAGFSTGHVTWTSTTGGFRNSASSETSNAAGSTDRALSVRQTGSFGDPGAAFQLQIANTTGKTAFSLSMKHQILDSQPRSAIWNVQYSTNGTSWTSVGSAFSDPGAFGSTTGSYSFGTALDNKSAAVYIRVVTLAGTTGSGNRDTYGIDDFILSWTNSVTAPTITGNNSQDFTYGIAGIYDFSATAGATINATLNPSGALPTGITLDTANTEIEVASNVPAGTYTLNISATNAGGTANKVVTLTVDPADQAITFGNITKVYGDADFTLTATGGASGEAITYSSSDTAIADITGETLTILQPGTVTITATQAGNANYNPATATATLTIGLKPIAITGATVNNKEYDSTNAAIITGAILNAAEIVGLDDVTLDANYTATFDNANIGTGKPVTVIFTLTGAQANRYELTNPAGLTGDITAKELTIAGLTANNKVYDATTAATLNGTATLSGVIAGDDVTLDSAAADASFATETAGTAKPVTTTGYAITGIDASNYTMEQPSFTADISAKQLTITGISIADKEFDGTTAATINGTAILNGAISGDDVTLDATSAVAVFIEANTGALIPVTVSGYAVTGADAANYSLQQPQGLTANIIDVTLDDQTITFNALTPVTYGDAAFTLNGTASSGLTVSYFSSDSTIASVTGNTVTILAAGEVTITAIQEGDAQYNPAPSVPQQLVINRKDLTVSGITVQDKIYNQTTVAVISGNLTGIVGADNVILSGTAQFADDNAGNNKSVTATFSINGADADNYTLIQPTGITGNILPAELTLASADAQDKVYDGTATATITGTLNGILTGDAVTFNGTGTFADANVNTAIAVTSTSALTGTDAANYTLVQPTGLTADITAMGITVIANAEDKIYDKTTTAQITITQTNGVVSGDDVTVTGTGSFANFNVGTDKAVTANLTLTGADAANYTLTQPTGLTADITAKGLTIDVAGTVVNDKTYNGTVAATLGTTTLLGVIAGDEPNVTVASAEFSQENVGNNIAVSNFVLSGSASGNYTLTQPVGLTADITPAALTITNASAQNKVYDGTTAAVITGTLTGVVAGDVVAYTGTGTFATENAGTGINVAASVTLTGTDAANYTITQPTGLTANITAKPLTVTATAQNKPYDSTVTAQVTNAAISGGIIIGDDVTLTATAVAGTFNNKNVGTNKPVSATFTLQGADAANYSVAAQAYTADITALSITADITAATVASKTYDGNTNATVSGVILTGILAGDVVTANTGTFGNSNVGTNIPVTLTLTGTDAVNYTLSSNTGLSGNINKKILLATADDKTKTQGSNNPTFTISYSGFVTGETAANAAGFVVPQATTAAIASSPVGAYPITLTGGDALNYELILNNGWLIINPSGAATSAILAWDFTGENNVATSDAEIANVNLDSSITLGRGPGAPASVGSNSFRTQSFQNNGISTANTDYFQFVVSADPGYQVSLSTINASFNGTATYAAAPGVSHQFAYSLNGTNFTLINTPTVTVGNMSTISVTVSGVAALQNIPAGTTVTLRYYATGQTSTGGWGFYSSGSGSYGLSVNGSVIAAPQLPAITSTLTDASNIGSTDTYQITASGTPVISFAASNLPVGATIDENGLISFDGTTPAGAYNINLEAASFYGADTKTLVYTVNKLDQVLTLSPDPIPSKHDNAAPFTITATNSSALPVTWASSDTNVATVDAAGIVTIVGVGTTTITVSNAGNNTYNPVSETVTLTVLATPVIQATPNPIVLTAVQGQGPSASVQLATVTAQNLLPADGTITMTVSTGFEIATGVSAYTTTGSFTYTGGAVNSTNPLIYVRLAAGHTAGTYTGTLTIEGGDASVQIPLNATVEIAPAITTTAAAYGPYCEASQNTISVAYTTEGNFPSGSYYVQLSNASGVFASDFSNIISTPATASPISATLPELTAGSYRVRVVHLATSLSLTASGNNNGTDIQINALPTLSGVTTVSACNGNDAQITLNGLLASTTFTATYTVNGETAQQVAITSNASGQATFTLPVTGANNGHAVVITQLTTGLPLACAATFTSGNTTNLIVTPAPLAGSLTLCTGATAAELTATGTDLKWYADATTTTELEDTAVLTTGNYFVSQTLNSCESTRTQVAVTVNTTPAPTAAALTFCTGATAVELTATGTDLKWYADATTTTEVEDTAVLTTGNYFVSQTLNNCESTRTQVGVTVNTTPAPTADALTFCAGTTAIELTATGTDLKWYADATTTTELEDTAVLTTGNYFVSQTLNSCESTRTQVAVTVNTTPAPTADALTFCAGATAVELTATGTDLKWYADATTTTELEDTAVLTTGNYFVSQTLNSCESTRTQVAVTVNTTPAPTADALTFCTNATAADLTATGTDLKWYADATTTTELEDTAVLTNGNYFVSQTLNGCESIRTQVAVTITILDAPDAQEEQDFTTGETLEDLEVLGDNLQWYSDEELTVAIPSTTELVDGTTYYVVQTQGECMSEAIAITVSEELDVTDFNKGEFVYYPNPVKDILNIDYTQNILQVNIYDLTGKNVMTVTPNSMNAKINMAQLQEGTYILNVATESQSKTIRVIKH